jgi:hypothetical protein
MAIIQAVVVIADNSSNGGAGTAGRSGTRDKGVGGGGKEGVFDLV